MKKNTFVTFCTYSQGVSSSGGEQVYLNMKTLLQLQKFELVHEVAPRILY